MVKQAGGRFGLKGQQVAVEELALLTELLERWGRCHAIRESDGQLRFAGRPGLWHALDELVPLQDPNRWDKLRKALVAELLDRGWTRSGPRVSAFTLPG